MLRLMLARHAKSSWDDNALSDHDRPLNRRGRRDAPLVGAELAAIGCVPEVVLCSTAARTRETWRLMQTGLAPARPPRAGPERTDSADGPSGPVDARPHLHDDAPRPEPADLPGAPPRVEFLRDLYLASPRTALAAAAAAPDAARTVMLLGHNPFTHALAARLSRAGDQHDLARLRVKFPTGAVAVIGLFAETWEGAGAGGELLHLVLPRRLPDHWQPQ